MRPRLQARLLVDCGNTLGECVRWSVRHQRVFWTDIEECLLYSASADGSDVEAMPLPGRLASFAFDARGRMVCAFADGLHVLDLAAGERHLVAPFEPTLPGTRMNDGCCDRAGRFVVGGYEESRAAPISSVRSYGAGGERMLLGGVGCANSIAFSSNGEFMYFADSPRRRIHRFAYAGTTGLLTAPTLIATLEPGEGDPDGSCIDAADTLWNAQFGGAAVQGFLFDGGRGPRVEVPVPNVTSCCFGGPDLDVMFISTARLRMTKAQLAGCPAAGGLFAVRPGVRGIPDTPFDGFPDAPGAEEPALHLNSLGEST